MKEVFDKEKDSEELKIVWSPKRKKNLNNLKFKTFGVIDDLWGYRITIARPWFCPSANCKNRNAWALWAPSTSSARAPFLFRPQVRGHLYWQRTKP